MNEKGESKMTSIRYPQPLKKGDHVAITAPSSGVERELHHLLHKAKEQVERAGYTVREGKSIWTNHKVVSCEKEQRAQELMDFLLDDTIQAISPPWGGHFLMEILPLLDWEALKAAEPKWILGYSDTSTLCFAYTIMTGFSSAHGTNYVDLSAPHWDPITKKWTEVLGTAVHETISQMSSETYQSSWEQAFENPGTGFYFDTPTEWKTLSGKGTQFSGRLIGGCLDTLHHLVGTPYGNARDFIDRYCREDGVIWYLESAELTAAGIYRALWQLKMSGWFEGAAGILFGRPGDYQPVDDFEMIDALHAVFADLQMPVVYDADIGHLPPQVTLVNGALATVKVENGTGKIDMTFK